MLLNLKNVSKLNKHITDPRTLERPEIFQMIVCTLSVLQEYYGLNCVSQNDMLEVPIPVPMNVALFEKKVFVQVITLKLGHIGLRCTLIQ